MRLCAEWCEKSASLRIESKMAHPCALYSLASSVFPALPAYQRMLR